VTRFAIVVVLVACGGRLDVVGADAAIDAKKDVTLKDAGTQPDAPVADDAGAVDPLCTAPVDAATNGSCVTIDGTNTCNPVTNFGCDGGAGEACDLGGNGFSCYPPPNDVPLCGSCDNANGPFCLPTMHCSETNGGFACTRFCCDDTDCTGGHCDKTVLQSDPVGVCVK
jgi:hypothetical protein